MTRTNYCRTARRAVTILSSLVIFAVAKQAQAQQFGLKFLGSTSDPVTGTAGVLPISNWNNISNTAIVAGNWYPVTSSDGATTAHISITGGSANNGWNSGLTGDGADLSLEDGYIDDGYNGDKHAIVTVSNLTASSYNVYIYFFADNTRPANNGDWIPNYSVNGTTYYVPILGNGGASTFTTDGSSVGGVGFTGYLEAIPTNANANTVRPAIDFGNYLEVGDVSPVNGTITVEGETDTQTFRSPINGIEIVASSAPVASPPTYSPPVNPVYAGTTITLNDLAAGAAPLAFQWLADNGTGTLAPVSGATSSNLVVNTTSLAAGNYKYAVIVTNLGGASTSSVATLDVVAASLPILVNDTTPTNVNEGYVGETLTFSAGFTGTLPINYQWMVNKGSGAVAVSSSSNPTATNSTLVLSNLQASNAGTYFVNANNSAGGPVATTGSALTVLPAPPAPTNAYSLAVLSNNPVAYWRLNETEDPSTGVLPTYDATGHNLDGFFGASALNGFNGVFGPESPGFPGFEPTNYAFSPANNVPNSFVTVPPMNLDTNTITITMWINPTDTENTFDGLFMWKLPTGDKAGFNLGGAVNAAGMPELGYTWNTNSGLTWGFDSQLYPPANQWSFIALAVGPSQATIYLYYIDPVTSQPDLYSAANVIPHGYENFNSGLTTIGTDAEATTGRALNGSVDEVAVFNRTLDGGELLNLFSVAAGLHPVLATIGTEPTSSELYPGATATFSASGINGTPPISYQWKFNGTNISKATNATLTISNVAAANAGSYQLFITNPVGVTNTSVATLQIVTPVANSFESAVLANQPFAFWKLNETTDPSTGTAVAFDLAGGHNGIYQTSAQNGFNGVAGPQPPAFPGFPANNTALGTSQGTANSYVTASAGHLVASNLTYVAWINPSGPVENWAGILMDRGGAGEGLGFGGSVDGTGMSEIGYTWNQNSSWSYNSDLYPTAGVWQMVAMAIQPSEAILYLINTNGVQSATNLVAQDGEVFGAAWHIGDDAAGGTGARTFPGSIADVAVYLTTLSAGQIAALYDAGVGVQPPPSVALEITPGTAGNVVISWPQGVLLESTNVSGPWTTNSAAVSPYTTPASNHQMFFKAALQ